MDDNNNNFNELLMETLRQIHVQLNRLEAKIDTKADKEKVNALKAKIETKANKDDVNALRARI